MKLEGDEVRTVGSKKLEVISDQLEVKGNEVRMIE